MRIPKTYNPVRSWRQQMLKRFKQVAARDPYPLVAISYLDAPSIVAGFVEVQRLTLVAMFEITVRQILPAICVAGFTGRRMNDGVTWGGPTATRFRKEFTLKPALNGPGKRLDARPNQLLDLALHMHRKLQLHQESYAHYPRATIVPLPPLWAAFRKSAVKQFGLERLEAYSREFFDLQFFPLDQVVRHASQATAIFADVRSFQTVRFARLLNLQAGLCGKQGPANYDFTSYPVRRRRRRRRSVGQH